MASMSIMSIAPTPVRCSGGCRNSLKSAASAGGGGGCWWAPIFGWSAEPDYIEGKPAQEASTQEVHKPGPKFAAFTEEKARKLRMRAMETETFHDAMYHSAIASRLASDVSRRSQKK